MSDEQDIDTLTHATRIGRPLTPEQRTRKQDRFLKAYRESANVKASCKAAGISRQTYYNWRDHDEAFQAQLPDAKEDACDTLEFAAFERAVKGVPTKVYSMGRVVYEEVPVLDENGKPKLNKQNEPIMRRGKPLIERKYSDPLLTTLLKANMPGKYRDNQHIDMNIQLQEVAQQAKNELLASFTPYAKPNNN